MQTVGAIKVIAILVVIFSVTTLIVNIPENLRVGATTTPVRFGVIGDFGSGDLSAGDVANLVKSWNPDFIVTVGDNNYDDGEASTIDANIGQFYHEYIYPYIGSYGAGATTNKFFPALGNHDWDSSNGAQPYLDYFTLPNNERYYDFVQGPVHFFVLDSDSREPDGVTSTSVQANWLQTRLAASTSTWKLVILHHAPFSSSAVHGPHPQLQWPYQQWGATAVLAGHDHTYERIVRSGFPYFVNGLGGSWVYNFGSPVTGSEIRYNSNFGAQRVEADNDHITFEFVTRSGALVDSYTINFGTPAVSPTSTSTRTPTYTTTPTSTTIPVNNPCFSNEFTGTIGANDPTQSGRVSRNFATSDCVTPKSCPTIVDLAARRYDAYSFTNNTGASQCISVNLTTACSGSNDIFSMAYLGSYNPSSLCANYLADAGYSPSQASGASSYSFNVPAGATFIVTVYEVAGNAGCSAYTLSVGDCIGVTATPTSTYTPVLNTGTPTNTPTFTITPTPMQTCAAAASHYFVPELGAPANGGTAQVGDRFVIDLMASTGVYSITTQQAYLTFTHELLQNADVSQIASNCVPTGTVTGDYTIFDANLQNEVCNGPGDCLFRGMQVGPGSIAFASTALGNPSYSGPGFRLAQLAFCASAPGVARLHWQFTPPDPVNRDTQIVDDNSAIANNRVCYVDYVINITGPTPTSTPTLSANLVSHVTWQGIPQPNARSMNPLTLTLKLGASQFDYPNVTTSASGFFTVSLAGLSLGNYNWWAKGPKWLANAGSFALTYTPTISLEMGTMLGGDTSGDNVVSVLDFTMFKPSLGRSVGEAGYNNRADFNNDDIVNTVDFTILRSNLGIVGPPP